MMRDMRQKSVFLNSQRFYKAFFAWQYTLNCCYGYDQCVLRSAITRRISSDPTTTNRYCTLAVRAKRTFPGRHTLGRSKPRQTLTHKTLQYSTSNDKNLSPIDARGAFPAIELNASVMKNLMSRIAHPIAVVTSHLVGDTERGSSHQDDEQKYSRLCAMTVSSINTVTLEPEPVISFNIRRPSRSHDAIFHNGGFNVQFLTASVAGRYMGEAFSRGNAVKGFQMLDKAGISWSYSSTEANGPLINGDGVLACVKCRLIAKKCVEIGDHTVIIATIDSVSPGPNQMVNGSILFSGCPGLTYVMREFREVGGSIPDAFNKDRISPIQNLPELN